MKRSKELRKKRSPNWNRSSAKLTNEAASVGGLVLFDHAVLKRHSVRAVFLEPRFRGVRSLKDLLMVLVADLFVRIDVDPDGTHKLGPTILFTLRLFGI
jgi:hypothetical protein